MKDKRDSITNAYSRAAEARAAAELDAAKPLTSKQSINLMNQLREMRMQQDKKMKVMAKNK